MSDKRPDFAAEAGDARESRDELAARMYDAGHDAGHESMREERDAEEARANSLRALHDKAERELAKMREEQQQAWRKFDEERERRIAVESQRDEAIRNRDHWRDAAKRRWEAGDSFRQELAERTQQRDEAVGLLREVLLTNALYETRMGALLAPRIEAFLDGPVKP